MKKTKEQPDKQKSERKYNVKTSARLKKTRGVTALSGEKGAAVLLLRGENKGLEGQLKKQKNGTGGLWQSKSNIDIEVDKLDLHPLHPKRRLDKGEVEPLANSISLHGLGEPLLVAQRQDDQSRYYIIDGARRWEAVKLLKWKKVRCNITKIKNDDQALGLILNMKGTRRDFYTIEKGDAFLKLRETLDITGEELATILQVNIKEISRCAIPVTSLCQEVIDAYKKSVDRRLSFTYLRQLAKLPDYPEQQWSLYQEAIDQKWSLDQMKAAVKKSLMNNRNPETYLPERLTHLETEKFNVYIKAKRISGIRPADVMIAAGQLVDQLFDWIGIQGGEVAEFHDQMAIHARRMWQKKRDRIREQATEYDANRED